MKKYNVDLNTEDLKPNKKNVFETIKENFLFFVSVTLLFFFIFFILNSLKTKILLLTDNIIELKTIEFANLDLEDVLAVCILLIIYTIFFIKYFIYSSKAGFEKQHTELNKLKFSFNEIIQFVYVFIVYFLTFFLFLILISFGLLILFAITSLTINILTLLTVKTIYLELNILIGIIYLVLLSSLVIFYILGGLITLTRFSTINIFKESFYFNHTLYILRKYFKYLFPYSFTWICLFFLKILLLFLDLNFFESNFLNNFINLSKIFLILTLPTLLSIFIPYKIGYIFREIVQKENEDSNDIIL